MYNYTYASGNPFRNRPIEPIASDWTWRNFLNLTSCVENQYNSFEVGPGTGNPKLFVNGGKTSLENVADIIGLQIAFKAFMKNGDHKDFVSSNKFTKEQLFFISFAQDWCEAYASEEVERERLVRQMYVDYHAPSATRVMGTLANFEEFSKAFNCPVGSKYNPEKKCGFFDI